MQNMRMQDVKMTDQVARQENAVLEKAVMSWNAVLPNSLK